MNSAVAARLGVIERFRLEYDGPGTAGGCGEYAIALNARLCGAGQYWGAVNTRLWRMGVEALQHVALMVDGRLYDHDGEIKDPEIFIAWGQLDPEDDVAEAFGLSYEECHEAAMVNLSALWGHEAEDMIRRWTDGAP